jgi:hypothetical protein
MRLGWREGREMYVVGLLEDHCSHGFGDRRHGCGFWLLLTRSGPGWEDYFLFGAMLLVKVKGK